MSCNCEPIPYSTKETHIPIIDSLGPFHDETILSTIDKILYILGVHKMRSTKCFMNKQRNDMRGGDEEAYETCETQRSVKRKVSCASLSCSRSPATLSTAPQSAAPTARPASDASSLLEQSVRFLEHPLIQELICPICGGHSDSKPDTTKLATMLKDYESYQRSPIKTSLRRSFSLCSLACRKIKKGLLSTLKGNSIPMDLDWFWTRRREEDCHQILEIYENSHMSTNPSQELLRENLTMILIVTPSGIVMPFEPVKSH